MHRAGGLGGRENSGRWRGVAQRDGMRRGGWVRPGPDRAAVRAAMSGGTRVCLVIAAILTLLYSGTTRIINKSLHKHTCPLAKIQKSSTLIIFIWSASL